MHKNETYIHEENEYSRFIAILGASAAKGGYQYIKL